MKNLLFILGLGLTLGVSEAAVQTRVIEYKAGETTCEGFLAYDDAVKTPRPGVLIVHQWKGLSDYEKKRAQMIVGLGYVAFCADIYGQGVRPADVAAASALAGKYKSDTRLYRERLTAALAVLEKQPQVDRTKLGVMGYCFGGTGALELARSGATVLGTVSFHGGLASKTPEDARRIKGRVLVLHGADDPFVPPTEVASFKDEMQKAGVRIAFAAYPGAVHSFTLWDAGSDNSKGAAYNKEADEKSWAAMTRFWAEVFGSKPS